MIAHDTPVLRLTQCVGVARADSVPWLDLTGYLPSEPLEPNFKARSSSMRAPAPVAPFAFHGFTSSC
jgi:hypothetical protein